MTAKVNKRGQQERAPESNLLPNDPKFSKIISWKLPNFVGCVISGLDNSYVSPEHGRGRAGVLVS